MNNTGATGGVSHLLRRLSRNNGPVSLTGVLTIISLGGRSTM